METFDVRVEVTRGQWVESSHLVPAAALDALKVPVARVEAVGAVRTRITRVENDG